MKLRQLYRFLKLWSFIYDLRGRFRVFIKSKITDRKAYKCKFNCITCKYYVANCR